MDPEYNDIQIEIVDRVGRIILSKPPLNVLTISMLKEIVRGLLQIGNVPDLAAVVFEASPASRAFTAGMAVEEMKPETVFQLLDSFHSVFRTLITIAKPVIVLVSGSALGAGCELVAFADIVYATPGARFGQPEIKLGMFPPVSTIMLPKVIGAKKALEMILTGTLLTAEEAHQLGLVSHVVAEEELETRANETLNRLRRRSAPALSLCKRAYFDVDGLPFEEALKRTEAIFLNELMSHRDPIEGVQAFLEKRPPRWKHK